ncbi:MAG: T9SS type A sorting domain-containing protein [Bacteroidota bacterium]
MYYLPVYFLSPTQLAASYNIFPNPAQNELTIAIESLQRGQLTLELTDMSGRSLFSNTYTKGQFAFEQTIDTSELPNGLYVVNVIQGGEKETKLVAIEK